MLKVKRLHPNAILPQVAHPGQDAGYDLFALEDTVLPFGEVTKVHTGIAASAYINRGDEVVGDVLEPLGILVRDRSSMAAKGIVTSAGVIDSTYTGEIIVLMTNQNKASEYFVVSATAGLSGSICSKYPVAGYQIKVGDKIAQMIPIEILTGEVTEVQELQEGGRGAAGFGSTGQ